MTDFQFWSLVISGAAAVGTLSAATIALFGHVIRPGIFPPRLSVRLSSTSGVAVDATLTDQTTGATRVEKARYHHVTVSNARRWSPATNVQVFLLRVEQLGPDGNFQNAWVGDTPLEWRFPQQNPLTKAVGPEAVCDLCSVIRGKWLRICVSIVAHESMFTRLPHNGPIRRRITVQARSIEVDSELVTLDISWDGNWADGDMEMQRHLKVSEIAKGVA